MSSTPQPTPGGSPAADLDARVAALEKYLAAPPASPSPSVEFYGGTIIHVRHVGSFHVPRGAALWAGGVLLALLAVVVLASSRRRSG